MELFNIRIERGGEKTIEAIYHSHGYENAKKLNAPLIHWLPSKSEVPCKVVMPDGSLTKGVAEQKCKELRTDDIVQFERFGFVRIDSVNESIVGHFAHR
jgi:glutamyl-tRNA synthetase